jgi:hypothetical protein
MPCSLFLQVLSSIIIKFIKYILLKINNNERHRSFHFCRAVLSTHSFFFFFNLPVSLVSQKVIAQRQDPGPHALKPKHRSKCRNAKRFVV